MTLSQAKRPIQPTTDIVVGDRVSRKNDVTAGRKRHGTVKAIINPNPIAYRNWKAPKAEVKWDTHSHGGNNLHGTGITSLIDVRSLVVVMPAAEWAAKQAAEQAKRDRENAAWGW